MSEDEADRRLRLNGRDVVATMAKADNLMLARDHRAANAFYGQVGRLASEGVPIDRNELLRARDATIWLGQRFKQYLIDGLNAAGYTRSNRHPRFQQSLELMIGERQRAPELHQFPQIPMTYFYPGTEYCTFADAGSFDWCESLTERTEAIREEARGLMDGHGAFRPYIKKSIDRPQGDVHGLVDNNDWSSCYLTDNGEPLSDLAMDCPETWAGMRDGIPLCDIPNRAPSVMLSLLRPQSSIPPHTGMLNTRFVCHLPLIIPDNCGLRCGADTRGWTLGEVMIFDDTVEHEAWNRSVENRLVLIFDVWRPEITEEEREQIRELFRVVDSY